MVDLVNLVNKCGIHTYSSLFPEDIENKWLVYIINIIHIIGVLVIQLGIFLPPKYLKYYILYLLILFISYILLNNRCFMTVLSNYVGKKNYDSLCIKMDEARYILMLYLLSAIVFFLYPKYALYNLFGKIKSAIV